jgi:hypothetical protein
LLHHTIAPAEANILLLAPLSSLTTKHSNERKGRKKKGEEGVGVSHCTRARKIDDWPAKVRRREEPCDFIAVLIFFRNEKLLFILVQ